MTTDATSRAGIEYALLGLLSKQPMHAYEMHQRLLHTEQLGLVWHIKQAHIYALLGALEVAGYLTSVTQTHGSRPPRKVLHLTPSGHDVFMRWMTSPVEHGRDFRLEFLAKLYFATQDDPATAEALIAHQRQACERWLADLQAQAQALETSKPFERLVLRFRIGQMQAILPWLDECAHELVSPATGE
jgi:DNA-binding PadR family transcriptional regulator